MRFYRHDPYAKTNNSRGSLCPSSRAASHPISYQGTPTTAGGPTFEGASSSAHNSSTHNAYPFINEKAHKGGDDAEDDGEDANGHDVGRIVLVKQDPSLRGNHNTADTNTNHREGTRKNESPLRVVLAKDGDLCRTASLPLPTTSVPHTQSSSDVSEVSISGGRRPHRSPPPAGAPHTPGQPSAWQPTSHGGGSYVFAAAGRYAPAVPPSAAAAAASHRWKYDLFLQQTLQKHHDEHQQSMESLHKSQYQHQQPGQSVTAKGYRGLSTSNNNTAKGNQPGGHHHFSYHHHHHLHHAHSSYDASYATSSYNITENQSFSRTPPTGRTAMSTPLHHSLLQIVMPSPPMHHIHSQHGGSSHNYLTAASANTNNNNNNPSLSLSTSSLSYQPPAGHAAAAALGGGASSSSPIESGAGSAHSASMMGGGVYRSHRPSDLSLGAGNGEGHHDDEGFSAAAFEHTPMRDLPMPAAHTFAHEDGLLSDRDGSTRALDGGDDFSDRSSFEDLDSDEDDSDEDRSGRNDAPVDGYDAHAEGIEATLVTSAATVVTSAATGPASVCSKVLSAVQPPRLMVEESNEDENVPEMDADICAATDVASSNGGGVGEAAAATEGDAVSLLCHEDGHSTRGDDPHHSLHDHDGHGGGAAPAPSAPRGGMTIPLAPATVFFFPSSSLNGNGNGTSSSATPAAYHNSRGTPMNGMHHYPHQHGGPFGGPAIHHLGPSPLYYEAYRAAVDPSYHHRTSAYHTGGPATMSGFDHYSTGPQIHQPQQQHNQPAYYTNHCDPGTAAILRNVHRPQTHSAQGYHQYAQQHQQHQHSNSFTAASEPQQEQHEALPQPPTYASSAAGCVGMVVADQKSLATAAQHDTYRHNDASHATSYAQMRAATRHPTSYHAYAAALSQQQQQPDRQHDYHRHTCPCDQHDEQQDHALPLHHEEAAPTTTPTPPLPHETIIDVAPVATTRNPSTGSSRSSGGINEDAVSTETVAAHTAVSSSSVTATTTTATSSEGTEAVSVTARRVTSWLDRAEAEADAHATTGNANPINPSAPTRALHPPAAVVLTTQPSAVQAPLAPPFTTTHPNAPARIVAGIMVHDPAVHSNIIVPVAAVAQDSAGLRRLLQTAQQLQEERQQQQMKPSLAAVAGGSGRQASALTSAALAGLSKGQQQGATRTAANTHSALRADVTPAATTTPAPFQRLAFVVAPPQTTSSAPPEETSAADAAAAARPSPSPTTVAASSSPAAGAVYALFEIIGPIVYRLDLACESLTGAAGAVATTVVSVPEADACEEDDEAQLHRLAATACSQSHGHGVALCVHYCHAKGNRCRSATLPHHHQHYNNHHSHLQSQHSHHHHHHNYHAMMAAAHHPPCSYTESSSNNNSSTMLGQFYAALRHYQNQSHHAGGISSSSCSSALADGFSRCPQLHVDRCFISRARERLIAWVVQQQGAFGDVQAALTQQQAEKEQAAKDGAASGGSEEGEGDDDHDDTPLVSIINPPAVGCTGLQSTIVTKKDHQAAGGGERRRKTVTIAALSQDDVTTATTRTMSMTTTTRGSSSGKKTAAAAASSGSVESQSQSQQPPKVINPLLADACPRTFTVYWAEERTFLEVPITALSYTRGLFLSQTDLALLYGQQQQQQDSNQNSTGTTNNSSGRLVVSPDSGLHAPSICGLFVAGCGGPKSTAPPSATAHRHQQSHQQQPPRQNNDSGDSIDCGATDCGTSVSGGGGRCRWGRWCNQAHVHPWLLAAAAAAKPPYREPATTTTPAVVTAPSAAHAYAHPPSSHGGVCRSGDISSSFDNNNTTCSSIPCEGHAVAVATAVPPSTSHHHRGSAPAPVPVPQPQYQQHHFPLPRHPIAGTASSSSALGGGVGGAAGGTLHVPPPLFIRGAVPTRHPAACASGGSNGSSGVRSFRGPQPPMPFPPTTTTLAGPAPRR